MADVTILVALESRFVRGGDGRVYSTTGVDGYGFWRRYLDVFDAVVVAARVARAAETRGLSLVEGPGLRVAALPDYHGPWGYARVRRRLIGAMAEAVAQADALCLRVPGPIGTCAWRLRAGRPYAVEVIGDPLEVLSARAVRTVARPLLRSLLARDLRAMCRGAEVASYVTEAVLQRSYPPGGWSTSYSSIDLGDEALVSEEQVRSRAGARPPDADGCWRLVFVGSLARLYKGPDVLIDAVALCRARGMRLDLTVIGDGRCRLALEARARSRGVGQAVRFVGQLPAGAAVREALDAAHLFVLPSRGEGLPRAMIEAMARGIPCLGTAVSGIPELLPEDRLVPPDDAESLARALGRLCSRETDLVALGLRDLAVARRYARAELQPRRLELLSRLRAASAAGRCATPEQGAA